MTSERIRIAYGIEGRAAYEPQTQEYRSTLHLPPDDMWTAFADQAEPAAVQYGESTIGSVSVDDDGTLHRFFVRPDFEQHRATVLDAVMSGRKITSAIVSTADPGAYSALMLRAGSATTEALLYSHEREPQGRSLDDVTPAVVADHRRACAFVAEATGGSSEFVVPYMSERIEREELFLLDAHGEIVAIGERRLDRYSEGHAHLGIVVGETRRGEGLGGAMMNTLVSMCSREVLTPLCSTTPENAAAQTLIHRAGFDSRHSVLRLTLS